MMYGDGREGHLDPTLKAAADNLAQRTVLNLQDLNLSYGDFIALADVNLSIAAGEFVALLGPSGCGKTSLLRSVAGFNLPQTGRIVLNDRDVVDVPPRARNIGIVFQNYALFPHMTALQNVAFGLECRGISRSQAQQSAHEALQRVRLSDFADRRPKQLSGGQQQRVALARAIVIEPELLLLDEPLAALDKQLRTRMQSELKDLQRSLGIAAIFVTHDQEEATAMADRIVVMRDGRVQQVATPAVLYARPANAWVAEFIDAGNLLSGEIADAPDGRWAMRLSENTSFAALAPPGVARRDARFLLPEHLLRVTAASGPSPFTIASIIQRGLTVSVQIRWKDRLLRAQLPVDRLGSLSEGMAVDLAADPDAGIWLSED